MEEREIVWSVYDPANPSQTTEAKKLPYVSPWKTFAKLPEDEKERIFNAMRGELILAGRMENK